MLLFLLKEKLSKRISSYAPYLPLSFLKFFEYYYLEYKYNSGEVKYFLEANRYLDLIFNVEKREQNLNIIMNMEQVINEFFDFTKPCPPQIPMCEQVREAYKKELDTATSSGCSSCQKNQIKSRFMNAIWTEAVQSLISKVSS